MNNLFSKTADSEKTFILKQNFSVKIVFVKRIFFSFILLFFSLFLSAQTETQNYGGRRLPKLQSDFHLVAIRVEKRSDNLAVISLFFNDALDASTVTSSSILINDRSLPEKTNFSFNKNQKSFRFISALPQNEFTVFITGINSWNKRQISATRIKVTADSFYSYSQETKQWQKS